MGVNSRSADEFRRFAQIHWGDLARSAVLLSGNPSDVDDLIQETFERLWRSWDRIRPETALGYARTVMVNARNDQWRKAGRTPVPTDSVYLDVKTSSGDPTGQVDDRNEILQHLSMLSERERQVIVARYYWGLTNDEVAASLSLPAGTIKSTASRAVARLRKAHEGAGHG